MSDQDDAANRLTPGDPLTGARGSRSEPAARGSRSEPAARADSGDPAQRDAHLEASEPRPSTSRSPGPGDPALGWPETGTPGRGAGAPGAVGPLSEAPTRAMPARDVPPGFSPPGYATPGQRPPGAGQFTSQVPGGFSSQPAAPAGTGSWVLAGWWRRSLAWTIDRIIVLVITIPIVMVFAIPLVTAETEPGIVAGIAALLLSVLIASIVAIVYEPLMMSRTNGKTVGRMAAGTRVVRADGRAMTFGTAAMRQIVLEWLAVGIASSLTFGIAFFLNYLWPLWDDEKRALHDYPLNTRTIRD